MDISDLFPARVRALQAIYPESHIALVNWGMWSRDRRGIFTVDVLPPPTWNEATSGLPEGYADAGEKQDDGLAAKSERAEDEPYDELRGHILDERLHHPGGPAQLIREALSVAYVRRDIHEAQYPRAAGCIQDQFLERLEAGLQFASRFL